MKIVLFFWSLSVAILGSMFLLTTALWGQQPAKNGAEFSEISEFSKSSSGAEFSEFSSFSGAKIFIPANCQAKEKNGDLNINCAKDEVIVQALNVEIGCFEAARTLVDLAGGEPRGLKIYSLKNELISTSEPFGAGVFRLDFIPAWQNEPLENVFVCQNGVLLSFFGSNKNLVKNIALNSKILENSKSKK